MRLLLGCFVLHVRRDVHYVLNVLSSAYHVFGAVLCLRVLFELGHAFSLYLFLGHLEAPLTSSAHGPGTFFTAS